MYIFSPIARKHQYSHLKFPFHVLYVAMLMQIFTRSSSRLSLFIRSNTLLLVVYLSKYDFIITLAQLLLLVYLLVNINEISTSVTNWQTLSILLYLGRLNIFNYFVLCS